jgi:hypothetical protein
VQLSPFVVPPIKPIVDFFHSTLGLNVALIKVSAKTGRPETAYYNTLIFLRAFDEHCGAIAAKLGVSVGEVLAALEKERTDAELSVAVWLKTKMKLSKKAHGFKLGRR